MCEWQTVEASQLRPGAGKRNTISNNKQAELHWEHHWHMRLLPQGLLSVVQRQTETQRGKRKVVKQEGVYV